MKPDTKDVVFVDMYNMIYRAFHGNQAKLTNSQGLPTNAIYTTLKMLQKIPQNHDIAYCLAVFDGGKDNFRKELDAEYKANRKPMPEELKLQIPHIKRAMEYLGWPMMQADGVEADDVIGSLAKRAAGKGFNVYIYSGDKDFRQLVCDNLHIIDTMADIRYDRQTVIDKMGVPPECVQAYLALLGDSVDNVQGIDGVGKGTAAKWLTQFGSLEKLIENQHTIKNKVGDSLRAAIANGQIEKNMKLIELKTDLDLVVTGKEVRFKDVDTQAWTDFCVEMNFKSFLKEIGNKPTI